MIRKKWCTLERSKVKNLDDLREESPSESEDELNQESNLNFFNFKMRKQQQEKRVSKYRILF